MQVDIFTAMQRSEFIRAYEEFAPPEPPPHEAFTTVIPCGEREINNAWMSPAPAISEYLGHRRFGNISAINYKVPVKDYDGGYEVLRNDIEDNQINGYAMKPKELSENARLFPGEEVIVALGAGDANACFDGSNFFASSHTIGDGNNLLAGVGSVNGDSHVAIMVFHGKALKPMIWYEREKPNLVDNGDTKESIKSKKVQFWTDLRGAVAYGLWWNAVKVAITGTPTVAEFNTILGQIETAFRSFEMPKGAPGDRAKYPHGQTMFSKANSTLLVSHKLGHIARQSLGLASLPAGSSVATDNIYRDYANLVCTKLIDPS